MRCSIAAVATNSPDQTSTTEIDLTKGMCTMEPSTQPQFRFARRIAMTTAFVLIGWTQSVTAQVIEEQTIQSATAVLNETMSTPLSQIPAQMLQDCHGVAIVPNVIKGSFIVGARHGKGLLFIRDPDGTWHAPVFITLTGGNVGWQVGVQASDIILVFKTARSVQGILSGKLTLGGDASAAAGPVGRQAAVATDGQLQAEIYTYSRSRGLFAGVSIDGTVLRVDQVATGMYYQSPAPGQPVVIPPSAAQLTQTIARYADQQAQVTPPEPQSQFAQQYRSDRPAVLQDQLLQIAPELFKLLDPQWTAHLALPLSANPNEAPDPKALAATVARYDQVAQDPQYASLAGRPEFQSVYSLLKHYQHALTPNAQTIQLPPPPGTR
ncbi:lipid-binding SYLF domain-containing protein [Rhodopirellula baltica]|uniref:Ysc84 actin-binding domain protein n=1 Tax=Rhodopirellula baltica SWK14 TaxID=993516 RepID=L7CFA9_RHOBT|nr:lipid-binding SYLF domain-containing protein [Rhodopirellula baltica]ELP32713.1 Ysc84 actin-binding domain protein [Rhodopirellula baltica SWK14]